MKKFSYVSLFTCCLLLAFIKPIWAEEFRLSDDVVPTFQSITLKLDPLSKQYFGTTSINIDVTKSTNAIKLYSKQLRLKSVLIKGEEHSEPLAVGVTNDFDITALTANNIIKPGKYKLSLSFIGNYTASGDGLFKVVENDESYLFTQFQSMLARTVFPTFDQPNFKIPFQFTLSVPMGYTALSNTPQKALTSENGWNTITFEATKPTYTDVLAFAVGKFDSVDIPNMPVPSKLYVVKGKLAQTTFATTHISNIYKNVESFFSLKYPYAKLDMIAVPSYADGAMENVGLVYFKEDFILLDETPSIRQQKYTLKLIAHEIAHMWFGNLVTMHWWNDLWLNESFAEWLAHKIVIDTFPELSAELDLPQLSSLSDDNVSTQQPIRRVVKSKADTDSLGNLAYSKGNAILNMAEQYVGEEVFRQAVIAYLKAFAFKNATLADFVSHIEQASGKKLSGFFESFLQQPGFPLLSIQTKNNSVLIAQQPFGGDENHQKMLWQVPLMISFLTDDGVLTKKAFLNDAVMELPLPDNVKVIFPDANAVGYYRYLLPDNDESVIKNNITQLKDNEKLAWLSNSEDLSKINQRAYADVLSIKLALLADLSLNEKVAGDIVSDLYYSYTSAIPPNMLAQYSQFITRKLQARLNAINWHDTKQDTLATKALKAKLLNLAGSRLGDEQAIVFAKQQVKSVLAGKSAYDSAMNNAILEIVASQSGESGEAQYQLFEQAYLSATDSNLKASILTAMGHFPSAKIVTRYYDFLISGKVPTDEIGYRFQYPSFNPVLRHHVLDYIAENKQKILKHINQQQWFPYTFYTSCSEDIRSRVSSTFATWVEQVLGLKEKLTAIDQTIKQCIQSREKNSAQIKALL